MPQSFDPLKNSEGDGFLTPPLNQLWRNNGNGTFTDHNRRNGCFAATGTNIRGGRIATTTTIGLVDILCPLATRLGSFPKPARRQIPSRRADGALYAPELVRRCFDFDHDGWMDVAYTAILWARGLPSGETKGHGDRRGSHCNVNGLAVWVAAFDYDNDGWVDLAAVGETTEGKGEVRLFRNLGPDGLKDVTTDVGLDKVQLKDPRAIITGRLRQLDGATDLLITQNHGHAVLLRNEGGNKNNWLRSTERAERQQVSHRH